jgi:hypothetical protein
MASRHEAQKKAKGGGVTPKHDAKKETYSGQGSHVQEEAEEEKRGGKVKHKKEHKATGGAVEHKASGGAAAPRLDKRARGGGVKKAHHEGGDMKSSPWSAAHVKPVSSGGNPPVHRGK